MKYDFVVHPSGDPNVITMRYGVMDSMQCSPDGKFHIYSSLGKVEEDEPYTYQGSEEQMKISSRFIISDNELRFQIGNYDKAKDLVIDPPTQQWGTYYAGDRDTRIYNVALDSSNNIYISGFMFGHDGIATSGTYKDTFMVGYPALIAKFDQLGHLIWATEYGGRGATYPFGLATDRHKNVIIGGQTTSEDGIATTGAHKQFNPRLDLGGDADAFLTKFDSTGALLWGTYYGGDLEEDRENIFHCVAIDYHDNIFLSGLTYSNTGIATPGAHQTIMGGNSNAFLAKFDPSGILLWGTYYGGTQTSEGECNADAVTVDPQGNAIIVGWTNDTDKIATPGAFQTKIGSPSSTAPWLQESDGFIAKFDGSGNIKWATYYGGTGFEEMISVCSDPYSNIYIVGTTGTDLYYDPNGSISTNLATPGSFMETPPNDTAAALIIKFDSSGSRNWATYFGGTYGRKDIQLTDICEINDYLFITGETNDVDGIATANAFQTTFPKEIYSDTNAGSSALLEKFRTDGARIWGSYFAGNLYDEGGSSVTTDLYENPIISGFTWSDSGITTAGTYQPKYTKNGNGQEDNGFLVKFCDITNPALKPTRNPICKGDPDTITLANVNYTTVNWKDGSNAIPWLDNSFKYVIPDTLFAGAAQIECCHYKYCWMRWH